MLTAAQQDRAFDYLERAWDAEKPAERTKWARKVLEINPDELDAYVLLSQGTDIRVEQMALLTEGVRRGKAIWSEHIKRPAQSYFWQDMDTRPFMRCVHLLALAQWHEMDRENAIANARFLLRLNSNDNQGIRYLLLAWYPVTGDWDAFRKLLKKYKDDCGTEYLYASCLNAFRLGDETDQVLIEAMDANPFVAEFLADRNKLPMEDDSPLAGYVTMGSEGEAHAYADFNRAGWLAVPKALEWILAEQRRITGMHEK